MRVSESTSYGTFKPKGSLTVGLEHEARRASGIVGDSFNLQVVADDPQAVVHVAGSVGIFVAFAEIVGVASVMMVSAVVVPLGNLRQFAFERHAEMRRIPQQAGLDILPHPAVQVESQHGVGNRLR